MRRSTLVATVSDATRAIAVAIAVAISFAACGDGAADRASNETRATTSSRPPATSTTSVPPRGPAPTPIGTYAVGVRTEDLVDASRLTPPNGGAPGAPTRSMPTTIWYPATGDPGAGPVPDAPADSHDGPFPIVVFAHGFANTPASYADLLARWASAGYVVVAPALPLLNADAPGGASHTDYGSPNIADFAFVLDHAIDAGVGDARRVAVAGHSDGEVLAYALAIEACCHDDRVGAAVLMAGDLGNANSLPAPTGVPVLHVLSDLDEYNPYAAALEFDRMHLAPPSFTMTLRSAAHGAPFEDAGDPHHELVALAGTDFLDAFLKDAPGGEAKLEADVAARADLATLESRR
jgi:dienelactone hydrolase